MSSARGEWRFAAAAATAVVVCVTATLCAVPDRVALVLEAAASVLRSRRASKKEKPIRVYMDGCFDLAHFGHANALRQAKLCGDVLVVGLIPDAEVVRCKGPPVLRERERRAVIETVKWVDEIIENVPYDLTPEFCATLYEKHGIDFIVHGDDPCLLPNGADAYDAPKKQGKFKMIKRTEGVSTTAIVDRILWAAQCDEKNGKRKTLGDDAGDEKNENKTEKPPVCQNRFLATARRIAQFSAGTRPIPKHAVVVYVHGAFDLFNAGHVFLLREAKKLGDFLLVGIWDDEAVTNRHGKGHPVLTCQERALGVAACRLVDDVVIGVPREVGEDLLATFGVRVVLAEESEFGTASSDSFESQTEKPLKSDANLVPKQHGLFRELRTPEVGSADALTTTEIIKRVRENAAAYETRNARKNKTEAKYYEQKRNGTIELARET